MNGTFQRLEQFEKQEESLRTAIDALERGHFQASLSISVATYKDALEILLRRAETNRLRFLNLKGPALKTRLENRNGNGSGQRVGE